MTKYYSPKPSELRELRARMNFTQTEMAEFLMCSTNAYTKWEQGVNQMSPMIWNAMQIIVGQADSKAKANKDPKVMSAEEKAFFDEWMADGWRTAEQIEADNWVYPEGHRLYHTNPKPRE
jgi:transcriptional regulator with XRE-family HTH domain